MQVADRVNAFVEKWGALLDEIDADRTRAKVYDFIESDRFEEDCRNLGFEMDCFESFNAKYNYDPSKHSKKDSKSWLPTVMISTYWVMQFLANGVITTIGRTM